MDKNKVLSALDKGSMRLEGRFIYGSNYTFLGLCQHHDQTFKIVYKPVQGERPLWDFPTQTLARREVAAYLVSEALGWDLVPPTVFRTRGVPMGAGAVQIFIEHDPEYHFFKFKPTDRQNLSKVMLFDLLINNADRKAGHLLIDPGGHLWLIDHGLCFHQEDKLRTVIWDYAGEAIPPDLLADIERFHRELEPDEPTFQKLLPLLNPQEIYAMQARAHKLLQQGVFPLPPEDRRVYPWPLV